MTLMKVTRRSSAHGPYARVALSPPIHKICELLPACVCGAVKPTHLTVPFQLNVASAMQVVAY